MHKSGIENTEFRNQNSEGDRKKSELRREKRNSGLRILATDF
jgi:hypothetical protein